MSAHLPCRALSTIRKHIVPLGLIFCATMFLFWEEIIGVATFQYDIMYFHYPMLFHAARVLKTGELPLWDPYLFCGTPFFSNPQVGLFYPLNLMALLASPEGILRYRTVEYLLIFHYFIAGFLMYILGLKIRMSTQAASLSALVYAFGGYFISNNQHLGLIQGVSWIPLVILLLIKAIDSSSSYFSWLAGIVSGLVFLAGYLPVGVTVLYGAVVFAAVYAFFLRRLRGLLGSAKVCFIYLLSTLMGAGIQLIPTLQFSSLSYNNPNEPLSRALAGLEPASFLNNLIFPSSSIEHYYYLGMLPILLTAISLFRTGREMRAVVLASFSLLIFALIESFGGNLGSQRSLAYFLFCISFPINEAPLLRAQSFAVFADFGIAILAGLGLDSLHICKLRMLSRKLSLPQCVQWLARRWKVLVLLIMLFNLFLVKESARFIRGTLLPETFLGPTFGSNPAETELIRFLQSDQELFRIDTYVGDLPFDIWGTTVRIHSVQSINGVDPFTLNDYKAFREIFSTWDVNLRMYRITNFQSPLLDMINMKYIVAAGKPPQGISEKYELVYNNWYKVYRNTHVLPRAFFVNDGQILDRERTIEELSSPSFNPRERVFLDKANLDDINPAWLDNKEGINRPTKSIVNIQSYEANSLLILVDTESDGFLFVSDVYFPGWKAIVDGRPEPILKSNLAFRAVHLYAGSHKLLMYFDPSLLKIASIFTFAMFLIPIALFVLMGLRKHERPVRFHREASIRRS